MGDWRIFSYYGGNARITLVRDAGAGMIIKHKFFYILRVSQQLVLGTRRRSGNLIICVLICVSFLSYF